MSFNFTSVEHFFASVVADTKKIAQFLVAHQAQVAATAETAVAVVSAINPAVGAVATLTERAGEALLGKAIAAIQDAGNAAAEKGVNLALDLQEVADIKSLIQSIEQMKPGALAVPPGLPQSPAPVTPAIPTPAAA